MDLLLDAVHETEDAMTMIPSSLIGSLAGTQLAQAKGVDTEKAARQSADHAREINADERAADAAGIGKAEEESATGEKDADGRQVLQRRPSPDEEAQDDTPTPKPGKDPAGLAGTQLDLEG